MRTLVKFLLNFLLKPFIRHGGEIALGKNSSLDLFRLRMRPKCVIETGGDCLIHAHLIFDREGATIRVGDRVYIGKSSLICAEDIQIGNDVMISWGVTVVDHDSHSVHWHERESDVTLWLHGQKDWTNVKRAKVTIEDRVWIGFGASILKGVTIGREAVVSAGAMVTKNVPPGTIVAGNPAKPIGTTSTM